MMTIQLTKQEFDTLMANDFLPEKYRELLKKNITDTYVVDLDEDSADEIREVCLEELPLSGFNEDYSPNEKGNLLEDLIDKFFTG